MPTEPHKSILDRDLSIASCQEFIECANGLLTELVNYSTMALVRCDYSASGDVDEDVAVLSLFRTMIEITDGIEVLVSSCCGAPGIPLVRTSFETLLAIEYILADSDLYAQRSYSWLVFYIHQKLDFHDRMDPSTQKGKRFSKAAANDEVVRFMTLPTPGILQAERSRLESFLNMPHIQPVEAEYQLRKKVSRWTQLFGGPANLFDLSVYLGKGAVYDLIYRPWSRSAHSTNLTGFSEDSESSKAVFDPLRDCKDLKETASFGASFMIRALRIFLEKFRPTENKSDWYKREIRERYTQMVGWK